MCNHIVQLSHIVGVTSGSGSFCVNTVMVITGQCGSAEKINFEVSFVNKKFKVNISQAGFENLHIRSFTGGCWEHIPFLD